MNCAEFSELVHDLARNTDLDEIKRQRALAHADACPRCDEELVMQRSLTAALRSLASSAAGADAPARVEEFLRREMRQQRAPVAMRAARANRPAIGAVAGLAAAALLAVVLFKPGILHRGEVASPTAAMPAAGSLGQVSPQTSAQATPQMDNTDTATQDADTEYATAYVPLPSADGTTFAEDQTIVRVSLPPSALASFGLPLSSDGRDSNVLADFVLGEDGMPRAVRLVQAQ
jgi:anti-sigma factor RsiW